VLPGLQAVLRFAVLLAAKVCCFTSSLLANRIYTGQDGIEKFSAEIVLEDMAMLDSNMPQEVKDMLEGKDAANGAPVQV
jgi:hypothetical protein